MKLKCIGGKCDGTKWEVEQQPGLPYKVALPLGPAVPMWEAILAPEIAEIKYETYTVRRMRYKDQYFLEHEYWYLGQTDMTDWECIKFQMEK